MPYNEELLQQLSAANKLSDEQIEEISKAAQEADSLEVYLLQNKVVNDIDIAIAKSEVLSLPLYEKPGNETIPGDILSLIPQQTAQQYHVVALNKEEDVLSVGMVYPESLEAENVLGFIAKSNGLHIKKFVISKSDFDVLARGYANATTEVERAVESFSTQYDKPKNGNKKGEENAERELKQLSEQTPITKIVGVMLNYAVESRASDIHIEPYKDKVSVRYRVDGKLKTAFNLPKGVLSGVITRVKILSNLKIDESRVPQDGRIHSTNDTSGIDYRVSSFPTTEGEKIVLRVLDSSKGILDLEKLGLHTRNLENIKRAMLAPFGMVLISGPTGSGKTTTLYSMLSILNQEGTNIVTLEDPVEYYMKGINQSQLRPEIGYTFASGLRSILRQDPDVIMVGEVRDNETAELVVHAALTGHQVYSTLHTNNAIGVIPRLLDMDIDDFLLPASLTMMVSQRLVPRLCEECKKKDPKSMEMIKEIEEGIEIFTDAERKELGIVGAKEVYKPEGCPACGNKGFKGRIAIYETLYVTPELEEVIISKPNEDTIRKEADRQGMVTMRQDGLVKVLQGHTSIEQVYEVAGE